MRRFGLDVFAELQLDQAGERPPELTWFERMRGVVTTARRLQKRVDEYQAALFERTLHVREQAPIEIMRVQDQVVRLRRQRRAIEIHLPRRDSQRLTGTRELRPEHLQTHIGDVPRVDGIRQSRQEQAVAARTTGEVECSRIRMARLQLGTKGDQPIGRSEVVCLLTVALVPARAIRLGHWGRQRITYAVPRWPSAAWTS